jgi:hypothetical protein
VTTAETVESSFIVFPFLALSRQREWTD